MKADLCITIQGCKGFSHGDEAARGGAFFVAKHTLASPPSPDAWPTKNAAVNRGAAGRPGPHYITGPLAPRRPAPADADMLTKDNIYQSDHFNINMR